MSTKFTRFQDMVRAGEFVVLDTETTGLDTLAQICQIAVIDSVGQTLLDTLVRPTISIPRDAARIHGITDELVKDAPGWPETQAAVMDLLAGRNLVIYNAEFDTRLMTQSAKADRTLHEPNWYKHATVWCAMNIFSPIYGQWNDYHGNYRWQKLTTAARYYDVPVTSAHSALGDCLMTLGVSRGMAGLTVQLPVEVEETQQAGDDFTEMSE